MIDRGVYWAWRHTPTTGAAEREGNKSLFCICHPGGVYKCMFFHQIRGHFENYSFKFFPSLLHFWFQFLHSKHFAIVFQPCLKLAFPHCLNAFPAPLFFRLETSNFRFILFSSITNPMQVTFRFRSSFSSLLLPLRSLLKR